MAPEIKLRKKLNTSHFAIFENGGNYLQISLKSLMKLKICWFNLKFFFANKSLEVNQKPFPTPIPLNLTPKNLSDFLHALVEKFLFFECSMLILFAKDSNRHYFTCFNFSRIGKAENNALQTEFGLNIDLHQVGNLYLEKFSIGDSRAYLWKIKMSSRSVDFQNLIENPQMIDLSFDCLKLPQNFLKCFQSNSHCPFALLRQKLLRFNSRGWE